jgi:hypothetical protein
METLHNNPMKIKNKSHSIERREKASIIRAKTRSHTTTKLVITPLSATLMNLE